jgi:hypothetical protein
MTQDALGIMRTSPAGLLGITYASIKSGLSRLYCKWPLRTMVIFCNGLTGIMRIYGKGIRNLSPVITTPAIIYCRCLWHRWTTFIKTKLRISPLIFVQIRNCPNRILRGQGITDSWKKSKISCQTPFRVFQGRMRTLRKVQTVVMRSLGKGIEELIPKGQRSSSFWFLRNLSDHLDRLACTRDTLLVKRRTMTARSHSLPGGRGGEGVKTTKKSICTVG